MNRVFFSIGPITVYWYAVFIVTGIILAMFLGFREAKRQGYNMEFFTNLVFYLILFGIIGTRLYYVLFNLDYYLLNLIEIFKVWNGGLAIHGGILAGIITTIVYTRKNKVNTLKTLDILAVSIIIGQIIGRWGNFLNQEAYGPIVSKLTLEKLMIPNFVIKGMLIDGFYRHPTFLYESVWNFVGLIIMLFLRRRKKAKVGEMTGFYLMWYSFARFFIEHLRTDSLMLGSFKIAQIVSLIAFVIGIIIIIKSKKTSNLYNKE